VKKSSWTYLAEANRRRRAWNALVPSVRSVSSLRPGDVTVPVTIVSSCVTDRNFNIVRCPCNGPVREVKCRLKPPIDIRLHYCGTCDTQLMAGHGAVAEIRDPLNKSIGQIQGLRHSTSATRLLKTWQSDDILRWFFTVQIRICYISIFLLPVYLTCWTWTWLCYVLHSAQHWDTSHLV